MTRLSRPDEVLLKRLAVEARAQDRASAAINGDVHRSASRLLDLLVQAGTPSGSAVRVDGTTYEFIVENEAMSDTIEDRRAHALLRAGRETLIPGPYTARTGELFLDRLGAIGAAFATHAVHDVDGEMHPRQTLLQRIEVACSEVSDRFLGTPGGVVRDVVDDVSTVASNGLEAKLSELRPVQAAASVMARTAAHLLGSNRGGVALIAGSGVVAATGAPGVIALAVIGVGIAKVLVDHLRTSGEHLRLTEASRAQLTMGQRVTAVEGLRHVGDKSQAGLLPSRLRRVARSRTAAPVDAGISA